MEHFSVETLLNLKNNINEISINDIKFIMGMDNIKPIEGTNSVKLSVDQNEDYFLEWYENDLRIEFLKFINDLIDRLS